MVKKEVNLALFLYTIHHAQHLLVSKGTSKLNINLALNKCCNNSLNKVNSG